MANWRGALAVAVALVVGAATWVYLERIAFTQVKQFILHYSTSADTMLSTHFGRGTYGSDIPASPQGNILPAYAGSRRNMRMESRARGVTHVAFDIHSPVTLTIHRVVFFNAVANHRETLEGADLHGLMALATTDGTVVAVDTGIEVTTTAPNQVLVLDYPFKASSPALLWIITLVFAVASGITVYRLRPSNIPALADLNVPRAHANRYRLELDGLRGAAALLVLLEHSWWRFNGAGATGVWVFFILSGYLLTLPFVHHPERAKDRRYLVNYLCRRVARILPMYYLTVFLYFGFSGHADLLFNHLLFIQAELHLWTIPQELFFYLLLPPMMLVVMLLRQFIGRAFLWIFLPATLALVIEPDLIGIDLYGFDRYRPPYMGWFMSGMAIAYITALPLIDPDRLAQNTRNLLSAAGLVLALSLLALSSETVVKPLFGDIVLATRYDSLFALLCGALLLLIILSPGTLLSRVFSFTPLRAVGIVGYSYYLLHPLVIDGVRGLWQHYLGRDILHGWLFLVAGILTWLVCLVTYSLVERPFLANPDRKP